MGLRRCLASLLSAVLVLLSPGLACYDAVAGQFQSRGAAAGPVTAAPVVKTVSIGLPSTSLSVGNLAVPGSLNAGVPGVSLPAAAASSFNNAAAALPGAAAVTTALPAGPAAAAAAAAAAAKSAGELSRAVAETIAPLSNAAQTDAGQARSAGAALQDVVAGGRSASGASDAVAVPVARMGELGGAPGGNLSYAKPAGRDSIGDAAEAYFGGPTELPAPQTAGPNGPQGPQGPNDNGGDGNGGGFNKGPLVPRLLTSAFALLPAALLGWPLLASGAVFAGALTILSSLGIAAMPFMSEKSPKLVRTLPGVTIVGLGVMALASGVIAGATSVAAMGALVTLGGWGFIRFAKGNHERATGTTDIVAGFFGALGAVTGAGLVLLNPAGLVASILTIAAYPVTLALFMYLPGWVGRALSAAVEGIGISARDAYHVTSSLRRDTSLKRRLDAYTNASIDRSPWNAVWLGLLVWLPILVAEATSFVIGGVTGLALGVVRAPLMALWGASHKLAKESKTTKFLAAWASFQFGGSKVGLFNRFEKPLIGWANSDNVAKRLSAAGAIRVLQLAWLAYNVVITPLAWAIGFAKAFGKTNEPYDQDKHDPEYFHLPSDPLPAQVPTVEKPNVTSALPSKLLATAIGLSPLYFLGGGLLGGGLLGLGAIAAAAGIGLMPVMPSTQALPKMLRQAPGTALMLVGGFAAWGAFKYAAIGLPVGMIGWLGILAFAAGIGLRALIEKLRDEKTSKWQLDEPEYIGGFVAALAISAALGASLIGVTGVLMTGLTAAAFVLSPLLLYHLPKSLWKGVGTSLWGIPTSVKSVHRVLNSWTRDSKFEDNLTGWYRHYTRQSFWYGIMFVVPFAAQVAAYVAEGVLALAVGLVVAAVRVPTRFAWGWAYEKQYDGKAAKFWSALNAWLVDRAEGSKKTSFDPIMAKLIPAMDEKDATTSRPTLKALLALTAARFVQLYWLVRLAVMLALTPILAIPAALSARGSDKAERP